MPFRLWRGVELCKCDMDFLFADSFRGKKKHNPHYIIYWWVWGREGRIYASCITRTLVLSIFNDVLLWKRVSQRPARQTGSCVDRCASATTLVSHLHYTTHRARNAAAQFLPNSVAISPARAWQVHLETPPHPPLPPPKLQFPLSLSLAPYYNRHPMPTKVVRRPLDGCILQNKYKFALTSWSDYHIIIIAYRQLVLNDPHIVGHVVCVDVLWLILPRQVDMSSYAEYILCPLAEIQLFWKSKGVFGRAPSKVILRL